MATLNEIKTRINGVKSTQKITKAMKVVATTRLKKYEKMLHHGSDYMETLQRAFYQLASAGEGIHHPLMQKNRPNSKVAVILISSDRGLCGSFNSLLFRQSETFFEENLKGKEIDLFLIGAKAEQFYKAKDINIVSKASRFTDDEKINEVSRLVAGLSEDFLKNKYEEVHFVYNYFESRSKNGFKTQLLFPFGFKRFIKKEFPKEGSSYIVEPSVESCLDILISLFLKSIMQEALLESQTAEELSRMLAMDYATENANELIGELTLQFNRKRQEVITKEISEIVGGAEALK